MSSVLPAGTGFRLPAGVSFWVMAAAYLGLMLAASAPSPLYVVYQHRFGFSALTLTMIFGVYGLVFVLLAIAFVATMVALALAAETVPRGAVGWQALRPRVAVSRAARAEFASHVPALVAPWAQMGFTLSLTTTLAAVWFGITDRF